MCSEITFFKGLLDKIGLRAQLVARGKYKSARETFAANEMSDASREMANALVDDLFEQAVDNIALARDLSTDQVRAALDAGPLRADEAKEHKLIDQLGDYSALRAWVKEQVGKYRAVNLHRYLTLSGHLCRGKAVPIAVIDVGGHIKSGRSSHGPDGPQSTGSRSFVRALKAVHHDDDIRAILLRVDSPGGSALASDLMYQALQDARVDKPILISMGDVAASGGYFVAGLPDCPIFARHSTITGSIGVLGGKFEARELYEKLGIKKEIVSRGKRARYLSDYSAFNEDESAKLERDLDAFYRDFVSKMADGRGKTYEEMHELAQGRVWTGRQAEGVGLTDRRGGYLAALGEIRKILELDEDRSLALVEAVAEKRRFPLRVEWNMPEQALPRLLRQPLLMARHFEHDRIFALLPFDIRFR